MTRRRDAPRTLAAAACLALALTACGSGKGSPASDAALSVSAAFYPLSFVAERVGGDRVDVTAVTEPGGDSHDVELSPRAVAALTESDLVVYLHGFQPALDDAVRDVLDEARTFDVTSAARLTDHADADEQEGHEGHDHAHGEHAHDHDGPDPHFWLDPARLADVGHALADRLAAADPEGARGYEAAAADLEADLDALDQELRTGLADCAEDLLVTSHDSFGYLAERYGLTARSVSGLDPEGEPDPRALARVADLVRDHGVSTVYYDALASDAVARTVARESGAQVAVLDPVEGLADRSGDRDYLDVMRANLETLRKGQSCR